MTEDKTIHLVRTGGKHGEKATVWCGRYSGVNTSGLDYINPSNKTVFRAVQPGDPLHGPTCGACRRSVGMLRTATLSKDASKGQRYKQRPK